MFKALMVLTFGVISNKVCYTLVCFYMLFFFGYTTLLFVEDYLNKLQRRRNEGSSVSLDGNKKQLRTALYSTLDF